MADGSFPTLVSKDRLDNAATNPIWTQLTDGSAAIGVTSNALDVNVTNTAITIDDLVAGTDPGEDNVLIFANTVKDGSGTNYVPLVDGDGQLQVDVLTMPAVSFNAEYQVDDGAGATDYGLNVLAVRDDALTTLTPVDGDYVSLRTTSTGALWVDLAESWSALTGAGTEAGVLRVTIANDSTGLLSVDDNGGTLTVDASDLDIRNLTLADDAIKVSANSSANSITNPIYVHNVAAAATTTEVHDYATATPGADASSNNDYTVTGTTFLLKSVIYAASGGMKVEVQTGPLASLATVAVGFIPRQGGQGQLFFDPPKEVPVTSTGTVRVIMTNRQGASMDVYSTIIGNDIP